MIPDSAWSGKVKLGGIATQGNQRRISLRGLQAATKQLLQRCALLTDRDFAPVQKYEIVKAFWAAVARTWPNAWNVSASISSHERGWGDRVESSSSRHNSGGPVSPASAE